MLDSDNLSQKVFESLAEAKIQRQGLLKYFRGPLNPANNSRLRSFTFDIQGFASLSKRF